VSQRDGSRINKLFRLSAKNKQFAKAELKDVANFGECFLLCQGRGETYFRELKTEEIWEKIEVYFEPG
jgi:hypothetical protein